MHIEKLTKWKLTGYWPFTPLQGVAMETGMSIIPVTPPINATVPGEIHHDLINAGIIDNPYYEMNSIKSEWVENRWWIYKTDFTVSKFSDTQQVFLVFNGIDYKAHIFLNNNKIAEHTGMYVPVKINITNICDYNKSNNLHVVIEQIPSEMGQIGYTSKTTTQKSRFGYKWDFGTRLVNMGLYDDVYIQYTDNSQIDDVHIRYDRNTVSVKANITSTEKTNSDIEAVLSFNGEIITSQTINITCSREVNFMLDVDSPKLWWPNGYGEQPLYTLTLTCCSNGKISDKKTFKIGLRTITYHRCEGSKSSSLPYVIEVNGVKMPIKGVNFTPLDHMYGAVSDKKYENIIKLAKEANVNLIRVWGGGLIEKEIFYNLCDKYGILVWQDFIQSSSALDNVPSEIPEFLELLSRTAECAVKQKRNHPCLAIWCGGNELMESDCTPVDCSNQNIAMLKKLVENNDSDRLFLPSTASGPKSWFDENQKLNHDIHGPWKYLGPTEHYRYFNNLECLLLGECGCDGMNNFQTLQKILSSENQKVFKMNENNIWSHHGQLWDTYATRDTEIFGKCENLENYCKISQYIQAEGIRYEIESQIRKFPKTAGINIWQFNEPWPNVSCTNLVDYYENPKLAYYFLKNAYKTFHVSMKYEKLLYQKSDIFKGKIYLHNELSNEVATVTAKVYNSNKKCIIEKNIQINKGFVTDIEFPVKNQGKVFYVECIATSTDDYDKNTYLFFVPEIKYADTNAVIEYYDTISECKKSPDCKKVETTKNIEY